MKLPVLKGEHINIRGFRLSDIESIVEYANDEQVSKFLPIMPYPYTIKDAKYWVNLSRREARTDKSCNFGIELSDSKKVIGGITLKNLNMTDLNAEVGYCIGRRFWKKGYSTEALGLILKFAFNDLKLRRVYAVVHEKNIGSVKLLEKAGFTREGIWRKASRIGNRWYDVYAYGILKSEFNKKFK
jgi:RimJ/RimL family protein N-acetyltransferase